MRVLVIQVENAHSRDRKSQTGHEREREMAREIEREREGF